MELRAINGMIKDYAMVISILVHLSILAIPLSTTVISVSGQGFRDIEMSMIDGSVSSAGARKVALSGTTKKRVEKKKEPKPPQIEEKAEKRVQQKKKIKKAVAVSREPDRASKAAADAIEPAEKKEEIEDQTAVEPEKDRNLPVQDILSAQAEDGEQDPASAVSAQDSLQGEVSGKPDIAELGSADGPAFIKRVLPRYPWVARKTGREGSVLLRLTIDETGRLLDVVVVEKAGFGFDREAIRAVRLSTFRPAIRKGMPVKSEALLYVRFKLEKR